MLYRKNTIMDTIHDPKIYDLTANELRLMQMMKALGHPARMQAWVKAGVVRIVSPFHIRELTAPLESHLSIRAPIIGIFVMQSVAMATLLVGTSLSMIGLFILLFGASYWAKTLARVTIVADQFGASSYGHISSIMAIFLTVANTAAPVGAALMYDRYTSYTPVLILIIVFVAAAIGLILLARTTHVQQMPIPEIMVLKGVETEMETYP